MLALARKHKFDYFEAFVKIADYAVEFADELVEFLKDHYDEEKGEGKVSSKETLARLEELHKIEDASDDVVHELVRHLSNEFVTPIEREDILQLSDGLDNVVDELDDVLQRMYMYHMTTITSEVIEMAQVVQEATCAEQKACEKFTHFKKSRSINDYVVKINDCEDRGDRVYIRSVHRIFSRAKEGSFDSPLDAVGLAGVLAALERCCDACEDVGDSIVTVLMKNS